MSDKFVPYFFNLSSEDKLSALEALIFASDTVLSINEIFDYLIAKPELEKSEDYQKANMSYESYIDQCFQFRKSDIPNLIDQINLQLQSSGRPFAIVNFAKGYQYAVRQEYGELVANLIKSKTKKRLSQATLETLSIIAYKQPISKPEVESIRGVNSNEIVNALLDRNLIKVAGRSEALGKPLIYATTDDFLKLFGLNTLEDLPKLKELEEIPDYFIENDNLGDLESIEVNEELGIDSSSELSDSFDADIQKN